VLGPGSEDFQDRHHDECCRQATGHEPPDDRPFHRPQRTTNDRPGNLIDTMLSEHRDMKAAQAFFRSAKVTKGFVRIG
jgi:hypothetical protein